MTGSFGGVTTALSSLIAQRQALEVAGQNIANANTAGYTRQRVDLAGVGAPKTSLFATGTSVGQGVKVTAIKRLDDMYLDDQLRTETALTSSLTQTADIYTRLEGIMAEPTSTGLTSQFQKLWGAFQDVSNRPDDDAARKVLLQNAGTVAKSIGAGYTATGTLYTQTRQDADTNVSEVNRQAAAVAALNSKIRTIVSAGGNANELMDERANLITNLSSLIGAVGRGRDDGTIDVYVGGNALVNGDRSNAVKIDGAYVIEGAASSPVQLSWARDGMPIGVEGGELAGQLAALAPANGTGTGGVLAEAAESYNKLAQNLAATVNTLHASGYNRQTPPTTGANLFAFTVGKPAAQGLTVAINDPRDVAAAAGGAGALDGSVADAIATAGTGLNGPERMWTAFVVDIGVKSSSATRRADIAEASRATAEAFQQASASVDIDEETANMVILQRAYEGAARVLTTIDEMLDVLINRTGKVGL